MSFPFWGQSHQGREKCLLHKQFNPRARNKTLGNLGNLQRDEVGSERCKTDKPKGQSCLVEASRCVHNHTLCAHVASVWLADICPVVRMVLCPLWEAHNLPEHMLNSLLAWSRFLCLSSGTCYGQPQFPFPLISQG